MLSWKDEKGLVDKQRNLKEVKPEKKKTVVEHSFTSLFQIGAQYATMEGTRSTAATDVPKFTT